MAENATIDGVAEQAIAAAKAEVAVKAKPIAVLKDKAASKTSAKEVKDEVCPDAEYGSKVDQKTNPTVEPPPPIRDWSLGRIDYYLLSFDDPPYEDEHY